MQSADRQWAIITNPKDMSIFAELDTFVSLSTVLYPTYSKA